MQEIFLILWEIVETGKINNWQQQQILNKYCNQSDFDVLREILREIFQLTFHRYFHVN